MKLSETDQEKPPSKTEAVKPMESPSAGPAKGISNSGFEARAGQWVTVRFLSEIISSLDEDGTLGGLPFMPEMAAYCGKSFRIKRYANKTCVNGESVYIGRLDQCVVLQMKDRCDGMAHAGCEMGCQFFWKTAWLVPGEDGRADSSMPDPQNESQFQTNLSWLKEKAVAGSGAQATVPQRYRCQATELVQIAEPIGPFKIGQYKDDHQRDKVSFTAIGSFLFSLVAKKLLRKSDNLSGPHEKRTPTESIGLEVGERVRVKPLEEIRKTLNVDGCNRGLWFDPKEMGKFCETEMVVSRKITKIIDEQNGELRILKQPTVVLSEAECSGVFRRFCSRGALHFWREIWLERVD